MKIKMKKKKGFTFVETLLSVMIVGIIAGVAAKVLIVGLDVYSLIVNRNNALSEARVAMDRMVREIVLLKSTTITGILDTRISFVDKNGYFTNFRKPTASYAGKSVPCIYRGGDFLAGNTTLVDFDYYKLDRSTAYWPFEMRVVNIDIVIDTFASAGTIRLEREVQLINY